MEPRFLYGTTFLVWKQKYQIKITIGKAHSLPEIVEMGERTRLGDNFMGECSLE